MSSLSHLLATKSERDQFHYNMPSLVVKGKIWVRDAVILLLSYLTKTCITSEEPFTTSYYLK